ncbi:MAG: hypothetical protein AWU54_1981, partial [Candidatus Frackibacter sp. T328-2]
MIISRIYKKRKSEIIEVKIHIEKVL